MNSSRLFEILFYLLKHKKASAATLAKEFGVSIRTIYRDVDSLSAAGIPVCSSAGRNGGVYLMEGYVLDRLFMTEQEQQDILLALTSLEATQLFDTARILRKLGSVFQHQDQDSIVVDFSRWGTLTSAEQMKFNLIKQAVCMKHCLEIEYINGQGEERIRTVEPLKLLFKESAWYLFAFCRSRQDFRLFRLSRILHCSLTSEEFKRDSDVHKYMEESGSSYGERIHLAMTVDQSVKYRIYDVFGAEPVSTKENGDVCVEVEAPQGEWLISFILSLGAAVKEIQPEEIRRRVEEQHRRAVKNMEGIYNEGE